MKLYYVPSCWSEGQVGEDEIVSAVRKKLAGGKNTRVYLNAEQAKASVNQNRRFSPNRWYYEIEVELSINTNGIEVEEDSDGD